MIGERGGLEWAALGTVGLGLCIYGVVALFAPEWAAAHLFHLLAGGGVLPFFLVVGHAVRAYQAAGEDVRAIRERNKALAATTAERLAALAAAAIIATDDDVPDATPDAWVQPVSMWFRAGDRLGFGVRVLAPRIVSGPDWGRLTAHFCSDAGWGVLQCRGGQSMTEWAEGWTLARVLAEVEARRLPCPPGSPPEVHLLIVSSTETRAKHTNTGQGRASDPKGGSSSVVIDQ